MKNEEFENEEFVPKYQATKTGKENSSFMDKPNDKDDYFILTLTKVTNFYNYKGKSSFFILHSSLN